MTILVAPHWTCVRLRPDILCLDPDADNSTESKRFQQCKKKQKTVGVYVISGCNFIQRTLRLSSSLLPCYECLMDADSPGFEPGTYCVVGKRAEN